ncbi:hypothetical protein [Chthonobacter rhizosphaerae]|uniref:hypothetical protein n=1 Tax=Chthonobacter rhizosphaerae TaxID=2735553 RepID=UPI0015EEF05E|nr:hypothetical protein [Chthonobacter rhizosphaerae]
MKAFAAAVVVFVGLVAVTGIFAQRELGLTSDEAYSTVGARVGEDGTPTHRGW